MQDKILFCYQNDEKFHCYEPEKTVFRFRPISTKSVTVNTSLNQEGMITKNYEFDETTNALADPKLNYLLESHKIYNNFLKNQLLDVGYTDALKVKIPNFESEGEENSCEPRKIPTLKKQKSLRNLELACKRKHNHEELIWRIENMNLIIQKKKEILRQCHVRSSLTLFEFSLIQSYFSVHQHNQVCLITTITSVVTLNKKLNLDENIKCRNLTNLCVIPVHRKIDY